MNHGAQVTRSFKLSTSQQHQQLMQQPQQQTEQVEIETTERMLSSSSSNIPSYDNSKEQQKETDANCNKPMKKQCEQSDSILESNPSAMEVDISRAKQEVMPSTNVIDSQMKSPAGQAASPRLVQTNLQNKLLSPDLNNSSSPRQGIKRTATSSPVTIRSQLSQRKEK